MIKKERQLIAEGKELPKRLKDIKEQKDTKNKEFPKFFKYFVMLDNNRKEIAKFANFDGTRLREGKVKDELKMISFAYLDSNYEVDEMTPLMSKLEGHQWMAYVNDKEWGMFLLFPKNCRRSEVSLFIQDLSKFIRKMEEDMGKSEDEIKKEFKHLMKEYLKMKSQKKTAGGKFDELDEKIKKIDNRVNHHLIGVTNNMNTAHATEILAQDLKKESAKIKEQAEALADLTGGCDMVTVIMICVGALLLIAVFGNLYVQMNAPPPPAPRKQAGSFIGRFLNNSENLIIKASNFVIKEIKTTEHILARRNHRLAKGLNPEYQRVNHHHKNLKEIKKQNKKRIRTQFGDIITQNKYFKIKNSVKGKEIKPLVRSAVPHISSFIGSCLLYTSPSPRD